MSAIDLAKLDADLRDAKIRNFSAREVSFLGGSHAEGRARNSMPDDSLRPALVRVARLAQRLREECGFPLIILSGYRSPTYNAAVGGAPNSFHKRGMALDLRPLHDEDLGDLVRIARAMHDRGVLPGGLGIYSTFVHIDTGPHRRW